MKSVNENVEIIALAAETLTELAEKISDAANRCTRQQCEKSRHIFSEKAPHRLLIAGTGSHNITERLKISEKWIRQPDTQSAPLPADIFYGAGTPEGKLGFLFPGQGSQYLQMGRALISHFSEAGTVLESAEMGFARNPNLFSFIYPPAAVDKNQPGAEQKSLQQTDVAQPAIGLISRIYLRILERHKVAAAAAAGHSFGELTALCAAGSLSEDDFFKLAAARGKFMAMAGKNAGDPGQMMAVRATAEQVEELIEKQGKDVVLANRNSPKQQVLSGPAAAISRMQEICRQNRILAKPLPVAAAFHSRLVTEAAAPFRKVIADAAFSAPGIPVYSNTTARPYPGDPEEARRLLGEHLVNPVNFAQTIENMYAAGVCTFLEVGPGAVLSGLVKQILGARRHTAFSLDASSGKRPAVIDMASALCRISSLGYPVALDRWPPEPAAAQLRDPDC